MSLPAPQPPQSDPVDRSDAELRALLVRYHGLRQLARAQHKHLHRYLEKGTLGRTARRLGLETDGKAIVFENEQEMAVLEDFVIHDERRGIPPRAGTSAVDRLLDREGATLPTDDRELMLSRQCSVVSGYLVERNLPGVGVFVREYFRGALSFVHDVGLGTTARPGVAFVMRVLQVGDVRFSSGAALRMWKDAFPQYEKALERFMAEELEKPEALRPTRRSELSAALIRVGLATGGAEYLKYE